MVTIQIAFDYNATFLSAVKEFHIIPCNPTSKVRNPTGIIVVPVKSIPTNLVPLSVPVVASGAQLLEIVAVDLTGKEWPGAYLTYTALPPVTNPHIVGVLF